MNETPDNDFARDARLAAIYRASAEDMPPPALDAAILAAARREVGSRPQPSGVSFARSWRGALSIAAVVVLSVSLVTLMREEAPEVVSPAGEAALPAETKSKSSIADNDEAGREARRARERETPKSVGLKPSHSMPSSGLLVPHQDFRGQLAQKSKDSSASRAEPAPGDSFSAIKRHDGFVDDVRSLSNRAAELKPQRPVSKSDLPQELAHSPAAGAPKAAASVSERQAPAAVVAGGVAEKNATAKTAAPEAYREPDAAASGRSRYDLARQSAEPRAAASRAPDIAPQPVAPAAPVAANKLERMVDATPEKWLERIEELRKQGRLDEARASLVEFKKRYPDFRLPASLDDSIR